MRAAALSIAFLLLFSTASIAGEVYEVEMLNRNETGALPYAPDYIEIAPGDTIRFLSTTSGHNAESIDGLTPAGAESFRTTLGEDAEVTFTVPGVYGVKCTPHFAMGMVMIVRVGDAPLDGFLKGADLPARARERFEDILARVSQGNEAGAP